MRNVYLDPYSTDEIDQQVSKILRDLGNPEPPLRLEHVRELLKLERDYYSQSDQGALRRWIHGLKMAGRQIADRPGFLVDVLSRIRLDAVCLLDERRILLNAELPSPKQRWAEAHEVGHAIIPWHGVISLGDDRYTLSADCHEAIEAEANYAARRLLFLQERFTESVRSSTPSVSLAIRLQKEFGNTLTTTFYGMVEALDVVAFGLVSPHPKRLPEGFDPSAPCRHFIRSRAFAKQFGSVTEVELFHAAQSYCSYGTWHLGSGQCTLRNLRGEQHEFSMETVFNHYDALTFGVLALA